MVSAILKDYDALYDKYYKVGKSYNTKNLIKQDKNNEFDKNLWKHFAENGIHGLVVNKKHGGKEFSALKTCVAFEALASGCENNGLIFSSIAHLMACVIPVANYGSDKQKSEFLNKMAKGEWIGANAITEQNSGSDVFKMECIAEKVKGGYKINGSKIYITNAPVSDVVLLFALTDKAKGFFGGISCFVFNSGKKGINISKAKDKMGLRTAQMGEIEFKDLLLLESSMIGKPGAGGQIFNSSMIWERVVVSAFLAGQLERVLTKSITYFKSKNSGDKKLIDIQYIQHKMAEFKTVLQASKNMVYDAAVAIDQKNKNAFTKASMTKLFVSENVVNAIRELQEIHGAYGYLTENGLEREYRDATAALIYSGTSAIQKNIISSGTLR